MNPDSRDWRSTIARVAPWVLVAVIAGLVAAGAWTSVNAYRSRHEAVRRSTWPAVTVRAEAVRRTSTGVELRVAFKGPDRRPVRAVLSDTQESSGGWIPTRQRIAYNPAAPTEVVAARPEVAPWWTVPLRGLLPVGVAGALWSLGVRPRHWSWRRVKAAGVWALVGVAAWLGDIGTRSGAPAAARAVNGVFSHLASVLSWLGVPVITFLIGSGVAWWLLHRRPATAERLGGRVRHHLRGVLRDEDGDGR